MLCVQVDSHIKQQQKGMKTEGKRREMSTALQDLLKAEDYSSVFDLNLLNNPWRAVEGYHFFLLVHRLFYLGHLDESLKAVCAAITT